MCYENRSTACATDTESEGLYDRKFKTIAKPVFEIHMVTAWLGCRNSRPRSLHACAAFKGHIYRFSAPVFGCSGGPGFGPGAVDFLEQLGVP